MKTFKQIYECSLYNIMNSIYKCSSELNENLQQPFLLDSWIMPGYYIGCFFDVYCQTLNHGHDLRGKKNMIICAQKNTYKYAYFDHKFLYNYVILQCQRVHNQSIFFFKHQEALPPTRTARQFPLAEQCSPTLICSLRVLNRS